MLADCDKQPYDIIVRNGGSERIAHITRRSGEIEEFGPVVSFQIKTKDPEDQKNEPIMTATVPMEEFCLWSGKIKVQRLDTWQGTAPGM